MNKFGSFRFLLSTIEVFFSIGLLLPIRAHAEIAVRDISTSEIEFQALAQALGHTPVSEFQASQSIVSDETGELFRSRLTAAQSEWLQKHRATPGGSIDQFLDLALEADWSSTERQAFVSFYIRKLKQINSDQRATLLSKLATFQVGIDDVDLKEMTDFDQSEWKKTVMRSNTSTIPELPTDVVEIKINGRSFSRASLVGLTIPDGPHRVTLFSNAFSPRTVKFENGKFVGSMLDRKPWVSADCSILKPVGDDPTLKMVILGPEKCSAMNAKAPNQDETMISQFGLDKPGPVSLPTVPVEKTSITKKPWFWGVVAILTVGAVVAVKSLDRQSQSSVQPVNHQGW
jgi:hypothetical protein